MRFTNAVDPMTEDPRDRDDREAELQREADEQALLEACQEQPFTAAEAIARTYAYGSTVLMISRQAQAFAADYGWPAVFRVLAAAIHAYDDAQARR
jgi:ATP-dependent exoDNAse (exonuclease V) beta subunit